MNILEITNLSKSYKNNLVLKNINLPVKKGESLAIVGKTGCGKTTLARCLCSFTDITSGSINFNSDKKPYPVQYIFQNHGQALNPFYSIEQSIREVLKITRKLKQPQEAFYQLMRDVDLDNSLFKKYPDQLSSGQKQRAVIARALAANPLILVADEPTSNLDAANEKKVLDLFMKLKKTYGLTLILISHNLESVKKIADRVAIMLQGEIIEILDNRFLQNAQHEYSRLLLNQVNKIDHEKTEAVFN